MQKGKLKSVNTMPNKKIRVLMLTPGFYPILGGTETMVREIAQTLNKKGVKTDVLTFNMTEKWNPKWKGNSELIDYSTVHRIPALNWLPHSDRINFGINLIPSRFTHLIKKYDIIHFHESDLSFPLFAFFSKKPKIFHSHCTISTFTRRNRVSKLIFKSIADYYIAITKSMANGFIELGIPSNKILCLPNSVNTELFYPKGQKEKGLLLFVGRIDVGKGLEVLLRSLQYLDKKCRLVIIGPMGSVPSYNELVLKLIQEESEKTFHIIEYLGALDHDKIVEWYQKAEMVIVPSFEEAFSIVILESLSCETPVVATKVGGIPEIIENNINGLLVPPNNPEKLGKSIQFLLDNEKIRIELGKEGRKSVIRKYSLDAIATKLSVFYRRLLL
jgi:glycosyltransferase involved in cell wall biosynthesis